MELEQMRQLDAIARLGTVSAAAEELHLSQSALSRSIQRLEAELGQPLFERAGKRVALNGAGTLALDYARQMLRDERLMRDALDDCARRARALRVGTVAPAPLWRLTALAMELFPQTVLSSQTLDERELERGVINGTLDLGISLRPCHLPTVRCCQLMTESLSVSLPAGHALSGSPYLSAAELDGETFLLSAGIGFWQAYCDTCFPHSRFIVQEDRTVFEQMLATTPLPYFVSDAPSARFNLPEDRAIVPLRDTAAHATFYLLVRDSACQQAQEIFSWVSKRADR